MAATDPTASFDIGMLKPIFRTDFIRSRRVTYREDVRHGEDYFVLLDFFVAGGHALLVPDALYWYVQPFGTLSRQWAHDGGRRYPFEHVKRVNDDVVADMSDRLSPEHLESLIKYLQIKHIEPTWLGGFKSPTLSILTEHFKQYGIVIKTCRKPLLIVLSIDLSMAHIVYNRTCYSRFAATRET